MLRERRVLYKALWDLDHCPPPNLSDFSFYSPFTHLCHRSLFDFSGTFDLQHSPASDFALAVPLSAVVLRESA